MQLFVEGFDEVAGAVHENASKHPLLVLHDCMVGTIHAVMQKK